MTVDSHAIADSSGTASQPAVVWPTRGGGASAGQSTRAPWLDRSNTIKVVDPDVSVHASGVATRGFEPPITPGLMLPVSWYLKYRD